jgi:putative restriction endonuclease
MPDPDADIRLAAFQALTAARRLHAGALPWSFLKEGFDARGQHFGFATQAEGIYRALGMSGLLSIKTVVPRKGRDIWYHDQVDAELLSPGDTFSYAFKGTDPDAVHNQWLKEAMQQQLPIIYFYGVAPALYEPLYPAFVTDWNAAELRCSLAVADITHAGPVRPPAPLERRHAMRTVQQRLYQAAFRERVLAAYDHRCALSGLPERRLIDAAHIIPDLNAQPRQPDVSNGICMSKIHLAAYDSGLIGIDRDLRIHVSEQLLEMHDGPLLEQAFKQLAGTRIRLPGDPSVSPDRDRLAVRFEQFRSGS